MKTSDVVLIIEISIAILFVELVITVFTNDDRNVRIEGIQLMALFIITIFITDRLRIIMNMDEKHKDIK